MKSLRERAMDLLARRDHAASELVTKLIQKGFPYDDVVAEVERLQSQGLMSDERFASAYVRYRSSSGFGPLRIKMELLQRGVSENIINLVVWEGEINWGDACREAWKKKFSGKPRFGSKEFAQQMRFLYQRGYPQEIIQQTITAD